MIPAEVELLRIQVPLVTPLRSAHGTETVRDLVLVRVQLPDGSVGWGECSALALPTYTSEYTAGAWAVLRDVLVPGLLAADGSPTAAVDVVGHPMASAALSTACLDADLRRRGVSLAADLGVRHGRPAESVAVGAVVGRSGSIDDLLAAVAAHVDDGTALIKLKVTPHPQDLAGARAVREAWPDLPLAVDGNGTLDARSVSVLAGLSLAYVEQPAPAEELLASAAHAGRLGVPVALDESITSVASLEVALALGAGQVINVKPARVGGVRAAADLARTAADAGCAVFVGGMLECGVGRAAALAVAALPACTLPTDLGPSSRYLQPDVTASLELDGRGRLRVPAGPGIGVVPDPGRLADVVVDRVVLTP